MNTKELTNIIYDTLFLNTNYTQFKELYDDIEWQEVDNNSNIIQFKMGNITYAMTIQAVHAGEVENN